MHAACAKQAFSGAEFDRAEEVLLGELETGRVVKVGETVRRAAGPWTPTIQALLAHLQRRRFPSPRPLGLDAGEGRESVSFLPGWASICGLRAARHRGRGAGRRVIEGLPRRRRPLHAALPGSVAARRAGAGAGEIVLHGDFGPL